MKTTGKALYAFTRKLDTKYDPCWRITVLMSKEEATKLKAVGLKPKRRDEDGESFGVDFEQYPFEFKFKRNEARKGGSGGVNPAPRQVDLAGQPFTEIIGNGSDVNVQFSVYPFNYKGKDGIGADFQAVQVVNNIPYEPTGDAPATSGADEFSYAGEPEPLNEAEESF